MEYLSIAASIAPCLGGAGQPVRFWSNAYASLAETCAVFIVSTNPEDELGRRLV
jgi:hypothetical protein